MKYLTEPVPVMENLLEEMFSEVQHVKASSLSKQLGKSYWKKQVRRELT